MMKKLAVALSLTLLFVSACKRGEEKAPASGFDAKKSGTPTRGASSSAANIPEGIDVGKRMPEYSAMWLDGSKFELASKRDTVVLVNVWATWCGPCRFEIPELQRIHNEYAGKGFEVIGVSVDESGIESVKQFVTEQKMTYPVVLDPEGKLATMLQTSVLPTTVLIGRDGKIVWKKMGAIFENDAELKKAIESAL